jgi:glycosyltransferase involved in cell wall biosynthesis
MGTVELPKVSVVMPTRNRGHLLGRALQSVFQQTYGNLEVVVLDDCSEDNTPEVIAQFARKHKSIRAFREKAGNVSRAIQQTVEKAQGEYIAQLDDDDFWSDPEKTAMQVAFLQAHPEYVAVGGGIIRINEQGQERARYLLPQEDKDIRRAMMWETPMTPIASMYRKSAWEDVGGFDPVITYADDWDLVARLGRVGKLYNIRRYLATYTKEDVRWSPVESRRLQQEAFLIRRRYRADYPGFWQGYIYGKVAYFSTFVPLWHLWKPWASRAWNIVRTRFF